MQSSCESRCESDKAESFPAIPPLFLGRRYRAYNDWIKSQHGTRLQKIAVSGGFSCPNRDGTLGIGGCSFCNNDGFAPGYLKSQPVLAEQIETGLAFLRRRYPRAQGFVAYFQTYTNTYADTERLAALYEEALAHPDISGLVIGTRPDCLPDDVLDLLAGLSRKTFVELEVGIESCADAVLTECLRGHDFACTQDAIRRAAARGLFVTGHLLLGLPLETRDSLIEAARELATLPLSALKFHQLQIMRHTRLAKDYLRNPACVPLLDPECYLDLVIDMLEYLPPRILIQRVGSEVPPRMRLSPDPAMRLSAYQARLEEKLAVRNTWQGRFVPQGHFSADR